MHDLQLELNCYRNWFEHREKTNIQTKWTDHFRNVVTLLWGPKNRTKSVEWNPWLEDALEAAHYHPVTGAPYPHVGFSGCASSGKSLYLALHGMVNWLCDPVATMVMITSTNLGESRKRVWAEVLKLWQGAEKVMPGVLIDSRGLIVTYYQGQKLPDTASISLVAGEKRKEKEAIGKIIGPKNKRVFMMADELPELTEAILEASFSNLTANELFQFIAGGNFKSRYDAFGVFVEPVDGYDTLTMADTAWLTKYGHCIRFDGLKSPNITGGEDKWAGIYSSKTLKKHRAYYNEHQIGFWRMVRSFEAPIGSTDCIYSESDFVAGKAREHPTWKGQRVKVSSLDPAFTNGGDRSVQWFAWLGQDASGKQVLDLYKQILLREDARKTDKTRNFQIAAQFRDNCIAEGVEPRNTAIDSTAAGSVFCDIVNELWSREILRVDFSAAASELSAANKTAAQRYDRRVSELWYVGVDLIKSGQLKGLTDTLIREMKARRYETVKGGDIGLKIRVETKDKMKERLGFSPDEADAYFILIDLCRQRHSFIPVGMPGAKSGNLVKDWKKFAMAADSVYVEDEVDPFAPQSQQELDMAEGF